MFRRIPRLTFSSDSKSSRQMTMLSRDKIERLRQVMIPWPFVSNITRPPRWLAQNILTSLALIQSKQKQRLLLLSLTMEETVALRLLPLWITLRMASCIQSRIKEIAALVGLSVQTPPSRAQLPRRLTNLLFASRSNSSLIAPWQPIIKTILILERTTRTGAAKVAGWRTTGSSLSNKEACSKMTTLTKPKTKIASTMQIKLSLTLVQSQISVVTSKTPRMLFKMVLWLSLSELLETAGRTTNQV